MPSRCGDGPSRYAYVTNDPLQRIDPNGQQIRLPLPLPAAPPMPAPSAPRSLPGPVEDFIAGCISVFNPELAINIFENRIRKLSDRELDAAAKKNGYRDAHDLKQDFGFGGETDIYVDKDGNMYGADRGGRGTSEPLDINVDGEG